VSLPTLKLTCVVGFSAASVRASTESAATSTRAAAMRLRLLISAGSSICFLVCERAGVKTDSAAYLADYLDNHTDVPQISLDRVLKAAGLIESMGKGSLSPRRSRRKR
jgi:hypothetical protein